MLNYLLVTLSFLSLSGMASPAAVTAMTETQQLPQRDVSQETQQRVNLEMRQEVLENRKRNTKSSYGDTAKLTSGPAKEWATWCAAGAGVMVYGLVTPPEKVIYDTVVTTSKKTEYIANHVSKRPQLTSNFKPLPGTSTSVATIKQHSKMLSDLYIQQCADMPEEMVGIQHPRNASVAPLVTAAGAKKVKQGKSTYVDPGIMHRQVKPAFTDDQRLQIGAYGIKDGAPRPSPESKRNIVIPSLHLETTIGTNQFTRNDSAHRFRLTTPHLLELDSKIGGPQQGYLVNFTSNESKANTTGQVETSASMRHKDNNLSCTHYALSFSFFYRWRVNEVPPPDFIPQKRADGVIVRPWYDEFLIPGNEKHSGVNYSSLRVLLHNLILSNIFELILCRE